MSKEKKLTLLFTVLIFTYLFYMTSCLTQTGESIGGEDTASSTPTSEIWISSSTSTSIPTASGANSEATEEAIRLALKPAPGGPFADFQTADFMGPSICTLCHIGLLDQSGKDVSMPSDWRSTMMAHAGIDPVWQAKVSSEVVRNPELKEVIEQKCVTCHMPMATTQALVEGMPVSGLDEGFFTPENSYHAPAIDGVSCTLCHQVTEENLGTMEGFSGHYVIDTATVAPDRIIYGPYQNSVTMPMQMHSGYMPAYGEHMLSAEHCATCHNLYTPFIDSEGTVLGEFPEQTPYTEWQHSEFGRQTQSCQSCHMPLADGAVTISQMPMMLTAREPFFQHYFVGGNTFMLEILANWGGELEVSASPEEFSDTIARAEEQLGTRTAGLSVSELSLTDGILAAEIQVRVFTGHKFPTSIPTRRAWMHVVVSDSSGQVIFESGKQNPDGSIQGNAADSNPLAYEPHYELITQPDQVQIYEGIMQNSDGEVTYTLLRAGGYAKDNRLLPVGTDKENLPADIAVYGLAAKDADFVGGSDSVRYEVNISGYEGPFTVSVELLYETLSYQFVQDLLLDKTELTERFGAYYNSSDKTASIIDSLEISTEN
ncbi:MAG TPA: hypothetical protein PLH64_03875 [Anaerolineaceae bacterium]|nr:hypothetical protein [Anaerolineaceae bacterium]